MFGLLAGSCGGWRRAAGVILAWVIVGLVLYLTAPPLSDVTTNSQADFLPSRSESQRALELVAEKFPGSQGVPAIVVFHRPDGLSDADLATVAEVETALQAEGAPPDIESVVALSTTPSPGRVAAGSGPDDGDGDRHDHGLAGGSAVPGRAGMDWRAGAGPNGPPWA